MALKQALAAEQAVVYGYGVAGAHLSDTDRRLAASRLVAHEQRRDQLSTLITALGAVAPAALPAYRLPFAVDDAAAARRLAGYLETSVTGAAWDLVTATASRSAGRELAVGWLSETAVAAARWGAPVAALPGRPS
jgi:hypothetical protein